MEDGSRIDIHGDESYYTDASVAIDGVNDDDNIDDSAIIMNDGENNNDFNNDNNVAQQQRRRSRSTTTTSSRTRSSCSLKDMKDYWKELFIGLILVTIWEITSRISRYHVFNERPIPYQQLVDDNGDIDYVRNLTNNEIFVHETISYNVCILLSCIIPMIIQFCIARFYYTSSNDSYSTICVYLFSFGLTGIITNILKNYVGYLRPIFYYYCQPDETYENCVNADTIQINDVRKSFPSGHASTAFCGLSLLTLYLHNHCGIPSIKVDKATANNTDTINEIQYLQTYYKKNPFVYRIISILSFIIPMTLACLIAASRVHDNKHFPADIVAGSILGSTISFFIYGLWF